MGRFQHDQNTEIMKIFKGFLLLLFVKQVQVYSLYLLLNSGLIWLLHKMTTLCLGSKTAVQTIVSSLENILIIFGFILNLSRYSSPLSLLMLQEFVRKFPRISISNLHFWEEVTLGRISLTFPKNEGAHYFQGRARNSNHFRQCLHLNIKMRAIHRILRQNNQRPYQS